MRVFNSTQMTLIRQMATDYLYQELSAEIIRCFYKVYNTLGFGFLGKVFENALKIELMNSGLVVDKQMPVTVFYDGQVDGEYILPTL